MAEIIMRRIGCRIAYAEPELSQVIHHCRKRAPDLIIVDDWSGGRRTGLALALQIRASHPRAPLLLVHDRDCNVALETVMAAGIQGFVLKGTNPDLLIASIRAVLAGEPRTRRARFLATLRIDGLSLDFYFVTTEPTVLSGCHFGSLLRGSSFHIGRVSCATS